MPSDVPVRCARQGFDPQALEAEVTDHWQAEDIPRQVREARAEADPFYFVDGPPYTSGHIHLGTAWNKVMKDLNVRYRTMQGLNVRTQPGWDMHGLPIEVRVEKELGFSTKQEIEALGVEAFVDKCRGFALEFLDEMTEEFKELGVWLDWERPYRTIDDSYMQGAWWAIKRGHDKDLLYRDNRGGLPWCPRCETALAQAEVEYEDRTDPSIYVKLPLVDEEASLVVWTTTPWTIPANNAVAVHPDLEYARVLATHRDGTTETLIIEDTCVDGVAHAAKLADVTVVDHMTGQDLVGLAYQHPFAEEVPYHQDRRSPNEYTVIPGDHVAADRTGLVHTATGHGAEDFEVGQEHGIPPFCPVGPEGLYTELAGELAGLVVRKPSEDDAEAEGEHADDVVIQRLEAKGLLLAKGLTEHSYGHCWRCKTPILYLTTEQWFMAVSQVRDAMLDEVARVTWTPEWAGAARQKDWVENARDWCISRQRYWGIPLPIWECQACDRYEVMGSKDELLDRAKVDEIEDLHRPWVDEVTMACTCGGTMERVPDVLDVWFDSAVASWASLGYPADEDAFQTWFPCDFIIEGLDQTRGWFYSQLAAGVVSMDRVPYEEVVMHGFVHDAEGQPMSKSLGNIVAPADVIAEHGADPMRWAMLEQTAPWDDLSFGPGAAGEASRFLNILWNVHYFATQYMEMDGYVAHQPAWDKPAPDDLLDAWLLSRLQNTVTEATAHLDGHEYHRAARAIQGFVLEDLSRWFVRLNRDRAWKGEGASKQTLYDVLTVALATIARLMAPFTPHTAEAIWQDLYPEAGSVHAQLWPEPDGDLVADQLEEDMDTVRAIVESVSQSRERAGLSLRWPVPRVVLAGGKSVERATEHLTGVLKDQTNARQIEYAGRDWGELITVAEPVRSVVGPTFKGQAPQVMEAIRTADGQALKETLASQEQTELAGFTVTTEMVRFTTEVPEGILGESFDGGSVFVDAHLDDELKADGLAREVLRRIQEMRKEADLELDEVVACTLEASKPVIEALQPHQDTLEEEGRVELTFGQAGDQARAWAITSEAIDLEEDIRIGFSDHPDPS